MQVFFEKLVLGGQAFDIFFVLGVSCVFGPMLMISLLIILGELLHIQTIFEFNKCLLKFRLILFVYQKLHILRQTGVDRFCCLFS